MRVGCLPYFRWSYRGNRKGASILLTCSGSGILLQQFVEQYDALPLILPVAAALTGNVGCIFASRLATAFHASKGNVNGNVSMFSSDNLIVMGTLLSISLPIHLGFLGFVQLNGTFKFGVLFFIGYLIMGGVSVRHICF